MEKGLIVHTAIIDGSGRVLIVKRSKNNDVLPGYWDIPGGTLEDGEDPAAGAARETKEETGLDISNPLLFFQQSKIDKAKDKQFVTLVFSAKYAGGEIRLNPEEHDEYAWINTKEINRYDAVDYLPDCFRSLPIF
jgi:8-oxo-dGTP pyrophosphatase MutT (NUDIX family)